MKFCVDCKTYRDKGKICGRPVLCPVTGDVIGRADMPDSAYTQRGSEGPQYCGYDARFFQPKGDPE